jgi:hypothetical protein
MTRNVAPERGEVSRVAGQTRQAEEWDAIRALAPENPQSQQETILRAETDDLPGMFGGLG